LFFDFRSLSSIFPIEYIATFSFFFRVSNKSITYQSIRYNIYIYTHTCVCVCGGGVYKRHFQLQCEVGKILGFGNLQKLRRHSNSHYSRNSVGRLDHTFEKT